MPKIPPKTQFALQWLYEPLMEDPTYAERRMFGALVAYIDGRQVAGVTEDKEPWNGLLMMTSREHHESLQKDFPALKPHPILGKWLYLSQADDAFETVAPKLMQLILKRDPRLGIDPSLKKAKKKKAAPRTAKKTPRRAPSKSTRRSTSLTDKRSGSRVKARNSPSR